MISEVVRNDIKRISDSKLNWDKLEGKSVLVTGATGFIGSFIIWSIMEHCKA